MRKRTAADAQVFNYSHTAAKRVNIPTAENQSLVPDDDKAVRVLRYPRNPDLDPQLVWRGKDAEDGAPLEVAAPPVYIQEKIHPRALIENLRRQSAKRKHEAADQTDFFHDFNGLEAEPEARTEFYAHAQNWQNRMILGDSLMVMGSLAEREALRGKVQCIYFDPPYGIKFNSNWQPSTKNRDVKDDNNLRNVSREPEVVKAFRDTWKEGINSYLSYLRDRIALFRDLLTESGSLFIQIGEENLHLVKAISIEIFGDDNFVNTIAVKKKGSTLVTESMFDFIVWCSKSRNSMKLKRLVEFRKEAEDDNKFNTLISPEKKMLRVTNLEDSEVSRLLSSGWQWARVNYPIVSQHPHETRSKNYLFQGNYKKCGSSRQWSFDNPIGLDRLSRANRLFDAGGDSIAGVVYHDDRKTVTIGNLWDDVKGEENPIYVVQTAWRIVQRCILMTTDPGDLVLDPTCGSGTTAYVAEQWGRRWITIDTSRVALTLARARLMGAKYDYHLLKDTKEGAAAEAALTGKPPVDGPFQGDIRQGFVYERAPHVTLKSIANNAEIDVIWERYQEKLEPLRSALNTALGLTWEEWEIPREAAAKWPEKAKKAHAAWWVARRERQAEIDASIARNADVEYLYDRPVKAKGVVRVSGPFTVESLSPHRVLPLGEDPYLAEALAAEGEEPQAGIALPEGNNDFAQVVQENLLASGVQNTKKGETISFEWVKPRVSKSGLVPLEGRYLEKGEQKRAAICIGPEYDTVGYDFVKRAAREAADLYDTLIVCGFAFAPEVDETRLNFGSLTVLKARMNQDLRMGDRLKATGAGNLFVIFGEPDLEVKTQADGMLRIEIKGMDIFDPTTGEVRSSGGSELKNDVAAWFIDDDYNQESFFVRHAYFVGQDPYDSLKRALKAEIDEAAWSEINATISRPFPKPASGLICVKVINHFGDEVQKVFEV